MARQYGTDSSIFNSLSAPLTDADGLPLIDTSNGFGSSPLGVSLREQIQFGLPNATFNLLPPDPAAAIAEGENPLPFWELQTTPNISATATYDTTTQTWGVKIDPGTAPSGDYLTLKPRSWVTTDDNLALRQTASLTASKGGTYAGTSQWQLTLMAQYFDHGNASLGSAVIGTVFDNTTWTSISGTTTAGGSAIPSSAAWAEFTVKLTATADVTSSTFATIKSLLLATSTPAAGGNFLVTDTYTTSGTWVRPTGVNNLLAVVGIGAGGGGAGGALRTNRTADTIGVNANGGVGGGGARWAIIRDLYVADAGSVTIGIGAGGAGGTANTGTKAAAGTTTFNLVSTAGGNGGATTFGSYLSIPGGNGAGTSTSDGGIPGTTITTSVYDNAQLAAGTGNTNFGAGAAASAAAAFGYLSFTPIAGSGIAGGSSSVSYTYSAGGTGVVLTGTAAVGGSAGYGGGGGAGQSAAAGTAAPLLTGGRAGVAGAGGGGGAGLHYQASGTISGGTSSAGNGGAGTASHGAGGGGGGGMGLFATLVRYDASAFTAKSGAGGQGSDGAIYVIYIA